MNITREDRENQTARLVVEISETDYQASVDKALRDYQRKAAMPGFRPGKVPMGIVKKLYGKAILLDEVNKTLSGALSEYITDQEIRLLGNPIPSDEQPHIDWENQTDFAFHFDIGLAPEINLELNDQIVVDYPKIIVDQATEDKYVGNICKRNGERVSFDKIDNGDLVDGEFTELNEDGTEKEGGIKKQAKFQIEDVKDEDIKMMLLGKNSGDEIVFDPVKALENLTEVSAMLGITKDAAAGLSTPFRFSYIESTKIEPATLDQKLYDKIYPGSGITSEEEFRAKVREDIAEAMQREAEQHFFNQAVRTIIDTAALNLPENFLKRWLYDTNEEKMTFDDIEKNFDQFSTSMKWELLRTKIMRDHQIEVTESDIRDHIRHYFEHHVFGGLSDETTSERLNDIINNILKNEKEVNRIEDELIEKRLMKLFKDTLGLREKEMTYEEFINEVSK